jgi:tRNA-splicing ligase RtcB
MSEAKAPLALFVSEALDPEVARFVERVRHAPDVVHVAVMPDVHLAGRACVGTVVATEHTLYPELLGSDLGCGVAAMALGVSLDALGDLRAVLGTLAALVPIERGARDPRALALGSLSDPSLEKVLARDGALELGTLGRGNHFLELRRDDLGQAWLVVHTGSRTMGPTLQAHHTRRGQRVRGGLVALDADSDLGRAYASDVCWALAFARTSRAQILEASCAALGLAPIDAQHDAVLHETHEGRALWVHRKGAMTLPEGALGVLPGSMGTATFIVRGRGAPRALDSSAHGAGRRLPRGRAARVIDVARLRTEMEGVVVDPRRLRSLVDEAPSAYKDVHRVARAQRELASIVCELHPVLVHKG